MHGPGGIINDVLAHRTQVDLKDKARNEYARRFRLGLPLGGFEINRN